MDAEDGVDDDENDDAHDLARHEGIVQQHFYTQEKANVEHSTIAMLIVLAQSFPLLLLLLQRQQEQLTV